MKRDRLERALRRAPMTARQIADRFGVSRVTAYEWIRALVTSGAPVYTIAAKGKRTGPVAKAYGLTS